MGKRSRDWNQVFFYQDGWLYWKHRTGAGSKSVPGKRAGAIRRARYSVTVDKDRYVCARIIWEMHFGNIPEGMIIDHIDRNTLNNKVENLRPATVAQNGWNAVCAVPRESPRPQSSVRGVSWSSGGRWQVRFRKDGRHVWIGAFNDLSDAEACAKESIVRLYGRFAPGETTNG
jgi:hypothetical protein